MVSGNTQGLGNSNNTFIGKVEILVNDQGNRITPSYVAFTDEERLVGDAAKNQYAANPKRTIYDIKYVSMFTKINPSNVP